MVESEAIICSSANRPGTFSGTMKFELISAMSPDSGAGALARNNEVVKSKVDFIVRTSLYQEPGFDVRGYHVHLYQ